MYKQIRNYENIQKYKFEGFGKYGIPKIYGVQSCPVTDFISFNYAKSSSPSKEKGIHFYIDDYQFIRLWSNLDNYIQLFQKYGCILSPDYSLYMDFPVALQIYNHYRKHYVAAYCQLHGITVIPTVCWSDKESFEWCFDGEPEESVVSVSSVSTMRNKEATRAFVEGYKEMILRLQPSKIIFHGDIPDECTGNIVHIKKFTDKFKEAKCDGW